MDWVSSFADSFVSCMTTREVVRSRVQEHELRLDAIQQEGVLLERCVEAMGSAKELLTKNSLRQCEELATLAVRSIFELDASVVYDMDGGQFLLDYGDGRRSDLTTSQSGGIVTVVSFVFAVYLIMRTNARRLMLWDESWMAVSKQHYSRFIDFVNQVCRDFGFDILLVSHDDRLTDDMVSRSYRMENGCAMRSN